MGDREGRRRGGASCSATEYFKSRRTWWSFEEATGQVYQSPSSSTSTTPTSTPTSTSTSTTTIIIIIIAMVMRPRRKSSLVLFCFCVSSSCPPLRWRLPARGQGEGEHCRVRTSCCRPGPARLQPGDTQGRLRRRRSLRNISSVLIWSGWSSKRWTERSVLPGGLSWVEEPSLTQRISSYIPTQVLALNTGLYKASPGWKTELGGTPPLIRCSLLTYSHCPPEDAVTEKNSSFPVQSTVFTSRNIC